MKSSLNWLHMRYLSTQWVALRSHTAFVPKLILGPVKFWWGQKETDGKIQRHKWNKLCQSEANGGMGFWNLSMFNQSLLAKQGWRLMQQTDSLLYLVLKAKYFPTCSFMEASVPSHSSYAWRSIEQEYCACSIHHIVRHILANWKRHMGSHLGWQMGQHRTSV